MEKKDLPVNESLHNMFPTLLSKGMSYLELKEDEQKGESILSNKPMNVFKISLDFILNR